MPVFTPDHNGECLHCDEYYDAHAADGSCPTDPAQAVANVELNERLRAIARATTPSITCPCCGFVSYNPHDIAERYCGACHRFQDPTAP